MEPRRLISALVRPALVLLVTLTAACDDAKPARSAGSTHTVACLAYLDPSIVAQIRDADGKPAALGAKLSVLRSDRVLFTSPENGGDSLRSVAYGRAAGPLDIQLTKPWFAPVVIKGIKLSTDACGHGTVHVGATLNLLPGAPPVRQIIVPYDDFNLGGGLPFHLAAFVQAAPGVSQQTTWVSRNPAIASITPDGVVTAACISTRDSVWVVASSVADANMKDSMMVNVWPSKESEECRAKAMGIPYRRGVITAITSGYGVRDANGPRAVRYSQMQVEADPSKPVSEMKSDKSLVSWSASTNFRTSSGQKIGSEALKVGKTVSVWITGLVIDTYPD